MSHPLAKKSAIEGKERMVFGFAGALVGIAQAVGILVFLTYIGVVQITEGGWFIASGLFTLALVAVLLYFLRRAMRWLKRALGGRWW